VAYEPVARPLSEQLAHRRERPQADSVRHEDQAGGTIDFIIGGFHLLTIYGPGTEFDDISTTVLTPIPGAPPGFPPVVDDPKDRIYRGLSPLGLPRDRVEAVNFANPGRYLVVCTVLPHFLDRMFGFVTVLK
jgi:hypothetical protein